MSDILKSLNVNKITIKSLRYGEPCLHYLGELDELLRHQVFEIGNLRKFQEMFCLLVDASVHLFELISPRLEHRTRLTRACGSNGKTGTFSISPPPWNKFLLSPYTSLP